MTLKINYNDYTFENKKKDYKLQVDHWHGWGSWGSVKPQCKIIKEIKLKNGWINPKILGYCTIKDGCVSEFKRVHRHVFFKNKE